MHDGFGERAHVMRVKPAAMRLRRYFTGRQSAVNAYFSII
jgi:hypothetical protein